MTHREWVALYFFFFTMQPHCISFHGQQGVSGTGFVFFTMQSHCISSHDQQVVSDTTFVFLYCVVSLHFILWPTGGEWQCICFSLPCSLMIFHPMTNSLWVTVYLVLFTMQSHRTSSYYQQAVSDSAFIIFYHAVTINTLYAPTRRYPVCFSSPLVLWRYSTYAWLIRTPSFHYDSTSCITPCWPWLLFYLHTIPCSLVPDTSHLYSLIRYALCPTMYIKPCT